MSATFSAHHVWLSDLEEELIRARELETAGKKHLDAQEKRVAALKAKNQCKPLSERLLHLMRKSHHLQVSRVRLLEKKFRKHVASDGDAAYKAP